MARLNGPLTFLATLEFKDARLACNRLESRGIPVTLDLPPGSDELNDVVILLVPWAQVAEAREALESLRRLRPGMELDFTGLGALAEPALRGR